MMRAKRSSYLLLSGLLCFGGCAHSNNSTSVQQNAATATAPSTEASDIEIVKVVYSAYADELKKEGKAAAISDEKFLLLKEYLESKGQVLHPISATFTWGGAVLLKEGRVRTAILSATIEHRSKTEATVQLHIYEAPMGQGVYEYRLTKTPKGWRIAKKEFVMAT